MYSYYKDCCFICTVRFCWTEQWSSVWQTAWDKHCCWWIVFTQIHCSCDGRLSQL